MFISVLFYHSVKIWCITYPQQNLYTITWCLSLVCRNERSFTQSLRRQQDEAYEESLLADQLKELKRRELQEAERAEQERIEQEEQERYRKKEVRLVSYLDMRRTCYTLCAAAYKM